MILIIWYLIFVAIGDVVAYLVGLIVERAWGVPKHGRFYRHVLFRAMGRLGVSVRITEPRRAAA